jgi:hypothetical protein
MHLGNYIEMVHKSQHDLAKAFYMVADEHGDEPDVFQSCQMLASWSENFENQLKGFMARYGKERNKEPDRMLRTLFKKTRKGSLALLRDLHDLWLMASEAHVSCIILRQAADALRDKELRALCDDMQKQSKRQQSWLLTRMKSAAPQSLIVAE